MVELFIEGLKIDLSDDISADITYSLADIRTPDKRQVNYSKTLNLVGTAVNNYVFGHIYDIDVSNDIDPYTLNKIGINYNPKKLVKAVLIVDSIQVFDGTLRLWKIVIKDNVVNYETSLFGKLFDLFSILADNKLSDLDFSDLNHVCSWPQISVVWNMSPIGDYCYPFIDYGFNFGSGGIPNSLDFGSLVPCIFYKTYIDRIFGSAGGHYILNFSDRTVFDRIFVTGGNSKAYGRNKFCDFERLGSTSVWFDLPSSVLLFYKTYDYLPIVDTVVINDSIDIVTGQNKYIFTKFCSTSIQINMELETDGWSTAANNEIYVTLLTAAGDSSTIGNFNVPITHTTDRLFANIEIPKADYSIGDVIYLSATIVRGTKLRFHSVGSMKAPSPADNEDYVLNEGGVYDMNLSVPKDITQIDFIKDFIKLFNLFVTQDPNDPSVYIFTPQVDFYLRDKSKVIDWSEKIDYEEEITYTPISQVTAKEYILSWKPDKDYFNELYTAQNKEIYGQVTYIADTDVTDTKQKIDFLFSPSVMQRFQGSKILCPSIYKMETVAGVPTKKTDKFNPRLLIWGGLMDAGHNIQLLHADGTVAGNTSDYPYCGHLDNPETPLFDLNFGNTNTNLPRASANQFSRYWGKILREANDKDGKLVACTMLIKPSDIEILDFAGLYKIDKQYFRLNKIEGFNPFLLDTSKVEMIKVIDL